MKKIIYIPMIALAAFVSCSKAGLESDGNGTEDGGKPKDPHSFIAEITEGFMTESGQTGVKPLWVEGDILELYTESDTWAYTLDENGEFNSEVAPDGKILYAAYPSENAVYSAAGLTITLPSEINYSEDASSVSPLYAVIGKEASAITKVDMIIPVGLLQVNYVGVPVGYDALEVISTGNRISGTFKIGEDGSLVSTAASSPNITTVKFEVLTSEKDMSFYIPAPTGTFESITFKLTGAGVDDIMIAEMNDKTINKGIVYELTTRKDLNIAFGEIASESLVFPYGGESRDYPVVSNAEWVVTGNNPEITAVKKDDNTVTVTVPAGKYLGGIQSEIKVSSADPSIVIAPAVINISQENNPNFTKPVGDVIYNTDGSVKFSIYPKDDDSPEVKKSNLSAGEVTRFGTYTFNFNEVNLASGFFHMESWFGGGCSIQLQFGKYNRVYYQNKNDETHAGGTSFSFAGSMPADLSAVKQIVLKLLPSALESDAEGDMTIQVIVDGQQILSQTTGMNPWKDETVPGLSTVFGITERDAITASGHVTIKSFEYTPEY